MGLWQMARNRKLPPVRFNEDIMKKWSRGDHSKKVCLQGSMPAAPAFSFTTPVAMATTMTFVFVLGMALYHVILWIITVTDHRLSAVAFEFFIFYPVTIMVQVGTRTVDHHLITMVEIIMPVNWR